MMASVQKDGGGGISPYEIYHRLTTGPGTNKLDLAQQTTTNEIWAEEERSLQIIRLANKIQVGWHGPASAAAYGATKPLADVSRYRAEDLSKAQQRLQDQSGAFHTAKNSVRPVSKTPPPASPVTEAVPWLADLDTSMTQYQDDSQHNITVFSAYDTASNTNGDQLPKQYPALKDPGGKLDIGWPDQSSDAGGPGTGSGSPGGSQGSSGGGASGGFSGVTAGSTHGGGRPVVPVDQQGSAPTAASQAQPSAYPPISPQHPVPGPTTQAPSTTSPFAPVGGFSGDLGGDGYRGGSGSRGGNGGGGGYGGGRGGAGGGANTGAEPGARSAAGAQAAEEALARRGGPAAGAGRGGAGGMMGGAGGGRGKRGEDEEHERPSFLYEDDPEDIFGTDQVTAPPVIE